MIEIEDGMSSLAKVDVGGISKQAKPLSIGELELALLERWPREDAFEWDNTGLLVGDPAQTVTGVAVALDVTGDAISAAAKMGANVLLTHHPAYLDSPPCIMPSYKRATASGVNVFTAITSGVALMNFHTALDVSADATRLLAGVLNLDFEGILEPLADSPEKGLGQVCAVRAADKPFKLAHLAARCTSVFGRAPRVWGDMSTSVERLVIANGSAGETAWACLDAGITCLVCGEIGYHRALDALQAGMCIVEVGHDVSEFPLTALLAQAAIDAGIAPDRVAIVDQSGKWSVPDSTRI
ncbi:MAG: Nif3-like dinuclear metal center hexameric protein [Eggerthellaceae bacterium]|nr:Nif3-like dinuclear metal center hexameric protein [Eggerthellaceae bacterium]